jgi:hypothetical protein
MDTTIRDDFSDFADNNELFNSDIKLYDSLSGTLKFEGEAIFDKKPNLVEIEDQQVSYQGNRSIMSFSNSKFTGMTAYFYLKGYYVIITDNVETKNYDVVNTTYSNVVNKIYFELKEA